MTLSVRINVAAEGPSIPDKHGRHSKDFPWLYHRNGGGVHMRRWVNHGPLRTWVSIVLPENEVVGQEFA